MKPRSLLPAQVIVFSLTGVSLALILLSASFATPQGSLHLTPLLHDPDTWKLALKRILIASSLWITLSWILSSPRFFNQAVRETTAGALGAIRFLVCGRLLMMALWEDFPSLVNMPDMIRQPMGVMAYFYKLPLGFDFLVNSGKALHLFQTLTALFLFFGMIGWRTRWTVPLGGMGAFIMLGLIRQYSFFWHQDLITLYVIAVLAFTPCGDGWSLDRLITIARGKYFGNPASRSRIYGWSRYACWVALAMPYVAAGLSKLRNGGLFWWNGTSLRRMLLYDTLNPMQFDWRISLHLASFPEFIFSLLGISAVSSEVLYGLVLIWPLARWIMPALMGFMHVGIIFLQNILFVDLILLQTIFFDFTAIRKAIGKKWSERSQPWNVIYDGYCGICQRTIQILKRLDLFERLRFFNFRESSALSQSEIAEHSFSQEALQEEMHVTKDGRVYKGFEAYQRLAFALPLGWLIAPFLWLPGVPKIGSQIYQQIAKKRFSLSCSIHGCSPHHENAHAVANQTPHLAPFAVAGLITVFLFCWIYRIEFYPFTAVQMYSLPHWRSTDPVVFYKPLGHWESGKVDREAFDEAMGKLYSTHARVRPLIKGCFLDDKQIDRCREFLKIRAKNYNKIAPVGKRVKRIEIQKWNAEWKNPQQQHLIDRFTVDIFET
jgi:predicted DCC family thiol-disulfide oxidoreductase YuxK